MKELDDYMDLLNQEQKLEEQFEKANKEIRDKMYSIESGKFPWVKDFAEQHKMSGPVVIKTSKAWLIANTDRVFDRVTIVPIHNFIDLTNEVSS